MTSQTVLLEDVNILTFLNDLVSSLWPGCRTATVHLSHHLDEQDKLEYRAAVQASAVLGRGIIFRHLTEIEVAGSRGEVLLKLLEKVESLTETRFQRIEKKPEGNPNERKTQEESIDDE